MRTIRIIGGVALLITLITSFEVEAQISHYYSVAGSKVTFCGELGVHNYTIRGNEINGKAEFGADFPPAKNKSVAPGKISGRMEGSIPIRSLRQSGGNALSEMMFSALKEQMSPLIHFRFNDLALKSLPKTNGAPFILNARSEIIVSEVTKPTSMLLAVFTQGDGKLKIKGITRLNLADFGVDLPEAPGSELTIKTREEVEVVFEWLLARPQVKPPPKARSNTKRK